mmetsp:Transcript_11186/g.21100  ORF Transcript_11186/g.21100 Transcript_11186/m.21100 type:complete len:196 (+) Transcript_11186:217-804(+)|eukprot:CAMPEP_0114228502 /NCGR_PEP_ID=MMETSP0058-20121206/2382_1 /TAXON_ID=36894 /ORGANISM="Pyramimonas parkeae, CCMP726" /LENGTH=195 /DNA_ID=CAMNT_0001339463 /DNA_START=1260 /DNA_END=1847 /DNA_ORIENTATION=-
MLESYNRLVAQAPLCTKALTAAVLSSASVMQWCTRDVPKKGNVTNAAHRTRAAKMFLFGLLWAGPSNHYWNIIIEHLFKDAKRTSRTAAKKVVVDQLTYGPLCNLVAMTYISLLVEGHHWKSYCASLLRKFASAQVQSWKVWPLATLINYKFVPVHLRPVFMNLVALLWTTFLVSSSAYKKDPTQSTALSADKHC